MTNKNPIWITNFKNHPDAVGKKAVELARIHEKVAQRTGARIAVCVSVLDLHAVSQAVSIPVFVQHIDPISFGSSTGSILPESVRTWGGMGTLINHSEKRVSPEIIPQIIQQAQLSGLQTILCAESPAEIHNFSHFRPDMLAFEPPELIGSRTLSVSSAHPESIRESVDLAHGIDICVGAGINTPEDVRIALELGAKGFLVATAITKSKTPEEDLFQFVSCF